MQWRSSHTLPRTVKLKSHPQYRYVADSDFDEGKDFYEPEQGECDSDSDEDDIEDEDEDDTVCFSETLVNTRLTLPNFKPDIERVIRATVKTQVQNWEQVSTNRGTKLVVTGLLSVGVEYAANVLEQSMHYARFEVPFHAFFLCRDALRVATSVEYFHYDTVDPRSIDLAVLVAIDAS